jgi:hypothetical protein
VAARAHRRVDEEAAALGREHLDHLVEEDRCVSALSHVSRLTS